MSLARQFRANFFPDRIVVKIVCVNLSVLVPPIFFVATVDHHRCSTNDNKTQLFPDNTLRS
jgi:hypothetical protein